MHTNHHRRQSAVPTGLLLAMALCVAVTGGASVSVFSAGAFAQTIRS